MGLEEALKILEQYDEGCQPEGRESLACGCGECDATTGENSKDPVGIDTSVKKEKSKSVKKNTAMKTATKEEQAKTATATSTTKKTRATAAKKRA